MRIAGLSGLVLAIWVLGFFFGRISAWLVPVTTSQMVTIERIHLRPLAIASDAPPSKMAEAPAAKAMLRAGSITLASTADVADEGQASGTEAVVRPGVEPRWPAAVGEPPRGTGKEQRRALAGGSFGGDAMSACERRFVSFRRSDGTYQPFNRPTRELCPFLR